MSIGFLVLIPAVFWVYKQQFHLPNPSLNPFDDQWEMKTDWLRENSDTTVSESCGYFRYEVNQGAYRIGYQSFFKYETTITGKSILVHADTVVETNANDSVALRSIDGVPIDSNYFKTFDYTLLDSVCSIFDYSSIGVLRAYGDFYYRPHYLHIESKDTIFFNIIYRHSSDKNIGIREFVYSRLRDGKSYIPNYGLR